MLLRTVKALHSTLQTPLLTFTGLYPLSQILNPYTPLMGLEPLHPRCCPPQVSASAASSPILLKQHTVRVDGGDEGDHTPVHAPKQNRVRPFLGARLEDLEASLDSSPCSPGMQGRSPSPR